MTRFAHSVSALRSSEIRDLMSLATSPNIISFSGGMPGNELFPLDMIDNVYQSLTEKEKQDLAQFYQQKQINNEPIKHGQRKWALIWWEV